jgi:predicted nucleic acid-binding protein
MSDAWVQVVQEHISQLEAIAKWASITGLGDVRDRCRMAQAELDRELDRVKVGSGHKSLDVEPVKRVEGAALRIFNPDLVDDQRCRAEAAEYRAAVTSRTLDGVRAHCQNQGKVISELTQIIKNLKVQRIYNNELVDAQRRRAEAAEARAEAAEARAAQFLKALRIKAR